MSEGMKEAQDLLKNLTTVMSTEAKSVFVGRLSELAYERHGSRDGAVLEIAVKDAEDTDLEWLEERLRDAAYDTISHLQTLIDILISQRDEALAEVERLRDQRNEADVGVHVACIRLQEIVDLVGEAGDGSALASVQSMMAADKHLRETLTQQRDMARAEVEMLRGVGCMEGGDGPCGACRKCAFRRGAKAMREAAMGAAWHSAAMGVHNKIRDLPDPEDKQG